MVSGPQVIRLSVFASPDAPPPSGLTEAPCEINFRPTRHGDCPIRKKMVEVPHLVVHGVALADLVVIPLVITIQTITLVITIQTITLVTTIQTIMLLTMSVVQEAFVSQVGTAPLQFAV